MASGTVINTAGVEDITPTMGTNVTNGDRTLIKKIGNIVIASINVKATAIKNNDETIITGLPEQYDTSEFFSGSLGGADNTIVRVWCGRDLADDSLKICVDGTMPADKWLQGQIVYIAK